MKKLMIGLLSLIMVVTLVGCSSGDSQKGSVDLSKYPQKFEEWKTSDLMKYFEEKGVFTNKDWEYVQNQKDPNNPSPKEITEIGSYMDNDGLVTIFIYYFDVNGSQDVKKGYEVLKEKKKFRASDWDYDLTASHMVGQFGFNNLCTNQEVSQKFEKAFEDLCKDMNVTKDY